MYLLSFQIHGDFIGTCLQRMKVIYQSLCQYKPGEIEAESEDLQMAYNNEARRSVITNYNGFYFSTFGVILTPIMYWLLGLNIVVIFLMQC